MDAIARQPEVGQHHLAHAVRRPGDDRDDGDLLPGDRAAAAVRQPAAEMTSMTIDWWTLGLQTVNVAHPGLAAGAVLLAAGRGDDRAAPRRGAATAGRGGGQAQRGGRRARRDRAARAPASRRSARRSWPRRTRPAEAGAAARLAEAATEAAALQQAAKAAIESDRTAAERPGPSGRAASRSTSPSAWPRAWTARRCAPPSSTGCSRRSGACRSRRGRPMAANGVALEAVSASAARCRPIRTRYRDADRRGVRGPSADRLHGRPGADRRPGTARAASRREQQLARRPRANPRGPQP